MGRVGSRVATHSERNQGHSNGVEARKLVTRDEAVQAKELLYRVYHEEMGWEPGEDNPSKIVFRKMRGCGRMEDDFEQQSTWFGAFDAGRLVGAIRTISASRDGLEVDRYVDMPRGTITQGALEVNRLAVLPAYRAGTNVFLQLIQQVVTGHFKTGQFGSLQNRPLFAPSRVYVFAFADSTALFLSR